jgi:hypothetical protein
MMQYTTEIEGNAFADRYLHTVPWEVANSTDRNKGLMQATIIIDRLNLRGEKTDATQELQFPRDADTEVPDDVKHACWLVALALLDGVDPDLEFENLQMVTQGYANVRSTYDRDLPAEHLLAGVPSIAAWRLLKPFLRDRNEINLLRSS